MARPSRNFILAAVAIASVIAISASAIVVGPMRYRTGADVLPADRNSVTEAVAAAASLDKVPGNLAPPLDSAAKDKPDLKAADGISCMVNLLESDVSSEPGGSCVAGGTENGKTTVMLIGDSHAYHWMPAMREVAIDRDWRLVSLTKGGCAMWDVKLVNLNLKRDYTECYKWRQNVMDRIAKEKPSIIVTSAAIFNPRQGDFADRWVDGASKTTKKLVATGAKVYVIEDTPYPRVDVPKCLAQHITEMSECTSSPADAYTDNDRRERSAEVEREAGATIIDPSAWFCTATVCPVVVGNTVVYTDISHMSSSYSTLLGTVLGKEFP